MMEQGFFLFFFPKYFQLPGLISVNEKEVVKANVGDSPFQLFNLGMRKMFCLPISECR